MLRKAGALSLLAFVVAPVLTAGPAAANLPDILAGPRNTVPECVTPGRLTAYLKLRNPKLDARYESDRHRIHAPGRNARLALGFRLLPDDRRDRRAQLLARQSSRRREAVAEQFCRARSHRARASRARASPTWHPACARTSSTSSCMPAVPSTTRWPSARATSGNGACSRPGSRRSRGRSTSPTWPPNGRRERKATRHAADGGGALQCRGVQQARPAARTGAGSPCIVDRNANPKP